MFFIPSFCEYIEEGIWRKHTWSFHDQVQDELILINDWKKLWIGSSLISTVTKEELLYKCQRDTLVKKGELTPQKRFSVSTSHYTSAVLWDPLK